MAALSPSTPRTLNPSYPAAPGGNTPSQPPPQPLEGYRSPQLGSNSAGGASNYVYEPYRSNIDSLAQSMGQHNITDPGYFPQSFVFSKLHTEEAGSTAAENNTFGFSTVAYDGRVYSQIRRFIVVKAKPREYYCLCVYGCPFMKCKSAADDKMFTSPITTYSGKGATKKSVDKSAHTIVYTGNVAPKRLPDEKGMSKEALRVIPVGPEEMLDPMSRINIGKIYPIEMNNKVKEIGQLDPASKAKLISYWKAIMSGA
ncbi:MAG: hypothetical protein Q9218_002161 [Villophora microphyllina]